VRGKEFPVLWVRQINRAPELEAGGSRRTIGIGSRTSRYARPAASSRALLTNSTQAALTDDNTKKSRGQTEVIETSPRLDWHTGSVKDGLRNVFSSRAELPSWGKRMSGLHRPVARNLRGAQLPAGRRDMLQQGCDSAGSMMELRYQCHGTAAAWSRCRRPPSRRAP